MKAVDDQLGIRSMLFNRRNVCLSHISGDCFNRLFTTLLSLPEPIKALTLKKIEQTMSEIAQSLRVTQTIPQDLADRLLEDINNFSRSF
jgi:hypothetical protein